MDTIVNQEEVNQAREAAIQASQATPEPSAAESLPAQTEPQVEPAPVQPVSQKESPVVSTQEPAPAKQLSERAEQRFQEMANARRVAEERAAQLEAERNSLLESMKTQEIYNGPAEITPEQYKEDVKREAQQVVKMTLSQQREIERREEAHKNFLEDFRKIQTNYSILNESSPDYDRDFDHIVTDYWEARVDKDPSVRLIDVVDKFIAQREKGALTVRKEQVSKIARQASQQAIAPSGGDGSGKSESLEQRIRNASTEEELAQLRAEMLK